MAGMVKVIVNHPVMTMTSPEGDAAARRPRRAGISTERPRTVVVRIEGTESHVRRHWTTAKRKEHVQC